MAWIESHQSLLNHRKTGRFARALTVSKVTAVGHLHAFWWWCMDNAPTGVLAGIDFEDIADGAAWEGEPQAFIDALVYAGFVDNVPGEECVHDWMDYAGKLIEKREKDAERKRLARQSNPPAPFPTPPQPIQRTSSGHPADGAGTVPNRTVPNRTVPNRTGESVAPVAAPVVKPPVVSPAPKGRGKRANTPPPESFPLTIEMEEWADATCPDIDLEAETQRFLDSARSHGRSYADWRAAWRGWMTNDFPKVMKNKKQGGSAPIPLRKSNEAARFDVSITSLQGVGGNRGNTHVPDQHGENGSRVLRRVESR